MQNPSGTGTGTVHTLLVDDLAELSCRLDCWRSLAQHHPLLSPEWLVTWWQHYKTDHEQLHVILVDDHRGQVVGLAPLYLEHGRHQRVIKLLGSGEACTDHLSILTAPGWETRVACGIAEHLLEAQSQWDELLLQGVLIQDTTWRQLTQRLGEGGVLLHRQTKGNRWDLALPRTWDDYLAALTQPLRDCWKQLQHDYLDCGRVRVCQVSSQGDFEYGYRILTHLHAAQARGAKRRSGFDNDKFRRFHGAVARHLLSLGRLRLVWLELEGRPFAASYQLVDGKTVFACQSGTDPRCHDLHPEDLWAMTTIRFAIEAGYRRVGFSRDGQRSPADWQAAPKACGDIRVWPSRLAGRVRHTMWEVCDVAGLRTARAWLGTAARLR